jgi:hypothetical protein
MVDAAPVRAHVKDLVDQGMRQYRIADQAEVSMAALGILLHGHYTPSRPAQTTIHANVAEQLLAVQFEAPSPRHTAAGLRCAASDRFEPAEYRVGRCRDCGELAPVQTSPGYERDRLVLVGHPTLNGGAP